MATATFGTVGGNTYPGTYSLGISLATDEYPTKVTIGSGGGYFNCRSGIYDAAHTFRLWLCDTNGNNGTSGDLQNVGIWPGNTASLSGSYTLTSTDQTQLRGKALALRFYCSAGDNGWVRNSVGITITTQKMTYTVTVGTATGGSAGASSTQNVPAGTTVQVEAYPNTGYSFSRWTVSGVSVTATANPVAFTMPSGNVTITPAFTKNNYTITKRASGGTLSVKKNGTEVTTAQYGDSLTLSNTANAGYEFSKYEATAGTISGSNFTMPASNTTITAVFTKINYDISRAASPTEGGLVLVMNSGGTYITYAQVGDTVLLGQATDSRYTFHSWTVRRNDTGAAITVTNNRFTMPASTVSVTANYILIHTLTWSDPGISVTQDGYTLTITRSGTATDNYGEAVIYYLYKDGTRYAAFNGTTMTYTLTEAELETDITFKIVAESSLTADGASMTYTVQYVHRTVARYSGRAWEDCVPYVWTGSGWEEVVPQYWNGTQWVLCSTI